MDHKSNPGSGLESYRSWQATLIFNSKGGASGGEKAKKLGFFSLPLASRLAVRTNCRVSALS